MVMGYSNKRSQSKTIDERISELIPQLADRQFNFKLSEHQRLRFLCKAERIVGDARTLNMPVNVRLSANDLVAMYVEGATGTSTDAKAILSYYALLRMYLELWASRSNLNPDEELPPMEDFVVIDDFLRSIHTDWYVASVVFKEAPPKIHASFRERRFSTKHAEAAPESPLARPSRYVSVIDQFHSNVWRKMT